MKSIITVLALSISLSIGAKGIFDYNNIENESTEKSILIENSILTTDLVSENNSKDDVSYYCCVTFSCGSEPLSFCETSEVSYKAACEKAKKAAMDYNFPKK